MISLGHQSEGTRQRGIKLLLWPERQTTERHWEKVASHVLLGLDFLGGEERRYGITDWGVVLSSFHGVAGGKVFFFFQRY